MKAELISAIKKVCGIPMHVQIDEKRAVAEFTASMNVSAVYHEHEMTAAEEQALTEYWPTWYEAHK